MVVTNQVMNKYDAVGSYVSPALGMVWAHSVNNRIVLETRGSQRYMTIAKSPVSPVVSFPYVIV